MRSIPVAMTWEMLQRGRWSLIGAALGANLLPVLLLTALRFEGTVDPQDPSQFVMHLVMVQINMFCFSAAVFAAQGQPSRLYAFPIPSSSLVAWQMLPAMALVALESIASAFALNVVFDLDWPLWGPAMFVAVASAAVQAALWLTEKSAWLPWAIGLVATLLGLWNKSRYGDMFEQPTRMWSELTPTDVGTLLLFAAVSYFVAVVAVARNRRGDAVLSLGIVAWLGRQLDSAPQASRPFRTPKDAQFWMEWQQKGWAMPAVVIFGMALGLLGWLLFSRDLKDLFEGFVAGGLLLSIAGFVVGLVMGNSGPSDANFEMGHFLATRPLTNTDLARTTLKVAAKSILFAWPIWAVPYVILDVTLLRTHAVPRPEVLDDFGWWYLPATLLGPWMVVMLTASACMTGRASPFREIFFGGFAAFIGWTMFSKYALTVQAQLQIGRGLLIAISIGFVLLTAWAFVAARRRALIGSPTVYAASSAWLTLCLLVVLGGVLQPTNSLPVSVLFVGLSALVVAPFATTPLALAWNRNR